MNLKWLFFSKKQSEKFNQFYGIFFQAKEQWIKKRFNKSFEPNKSIHSKFIFDAKNKSKQVRDTQEGKI